METGWFKTIFAAIGAAAAYLWGPWDALILVLLAFVATDYATGLINAFVRHEADSAVGFIGLAKKVMIFVLVAVGALLDKIMPATNGAVRAAVCLFYVANEGLSILENAGALGLPLPSILKKWLVKLKEADDVETTDQSE